MTAGIQCWNANGLSLDVTTRLTKVLGKVYFPEFTLTSSGKVPSSVNGKISDERLKYGTPFFFFTPGYNSTRFYAGWAALGPEVSISGGTLSWEWDADTVSAWASAVFGNDTAGDSYLVYGIF